MFYYTKAILLVLRYLYPFKLTSPWAPGDGEGLACSVHDRIQRLAGVQASETEVWLDQAKLWKNTHCWHNHIFVPFFVMKYLAPR